ncbi:MAG: CapA family protein [Euzebya sp.]
MLIAAALPIVMASPSRSDAQTDPAVDLPVTRIAGEDRVATSELTAEQWIDGGGTADSIVVVHRDNTAVALSSAGLAGGEQTVTVLSDNPPSSSTVAIAHRVGATRVLVVGAGQAMADAWGLEGFEVTQIDAAGGPPAVAAVIARELYREPVAGQPRRAFLAGTGGLPDALAVGPVAYDTAQPVLLTAAESLDPHTRFILQQQQVSQVTILGGTAVVSTGVAEELTAMGISVERLAGADREATALAIAAGRGEIQRGFLAAGDDPADAAGAAALASQTGAVLLAPGPTTRQWLSQRCGHAPAITVLGGHAAVSQVVEDQHRSAAQRCDGAGLAMTVRVAIVVPPADTAGVVETVTGPQGWGSRRVRFVGVGTKPHVGVVVADGGSCGGAVLCRRDNTMVIDGTAWSASDIVARQRLVNVALGSWLGEPQGSTCSDEVMDPLSCPSPSAPSADAKERVGQRFIPTITLAFGGDVHGERHIATAVAEGRNPLGPVTDQLSAADLAVINLETPLSTRGTPAVKTFVFRGPPALAQDLVEAGVDVVTLANNHALDYGVDALADTLAHTQAAGLQTVGAGLDATAAYSPALFDTPAGRIAIIGVTRVLHTRAWEATANRPGLASAYDEPAAVAAVRAAADIADQVIVAIHWGTERADCPDADQRHLADLLTRSGADLVVGHHPHILQGVQRLNDGLVAYSMGNFVWYHNSAPSRFTGILEVDLPLLDAPQWRFSPAEIGTDGSPHPASGSLGQAITARVTDRSPGGAVGCGFP